MVAYPRVEPASRAAWRAWLRANHARAPGVWLVLDKVTAPRRRLLYEDAAEELVCFGWVDSRPAKLDATRSLLLCTPRKPTAKWSAKNKARAEKMRAAGKLAAAGEAAIARAQADGTWAALDEVEALAVPPDLARLLRGDARRYFDAFPRSVKRSILEWIAAARQPATRARRVAETARLAAQNRRANQWRDRDRT